MHEPVSYMAIAWMTVLLAVVAVISVPGPPADPRPGELTLILATLLVLYGAVERTAYYLDAA